MGIGRVALEKLLHVLVEQAVVSQPLAEGLELLGRRHLAIDEQVAHLDERGMLGETFDVEAAVAEYAVGPVDVGDSAFAGARVAVAGVERDDARLAAELADVNGDFVLGAGDDGEVALLPVDSDLCRLLCRLHVPCAKR